jgi:dihydroorotate dehydrogenase (NAD+) catalytic subunit
MIDLAPHNPYGLTLASPVIVAPGCVMSWRELDPALVGAAATRVAIAHGVDERPIRWGAVPAGVVIERLPTIRLRTLLQGEASRWTRATVPVLLTLRGTPDELAEMSDRLEPLESLAGLIVQPVGSSEACADGVAAVRDRTALPILVLLPPVIEAPNIAAIVEADADALIVGAYPSAAASTGDALVEGSLIGPALAPWTLHALHKTRSATDVPLIALGGIASADVARHCLAAGASALMIDGALHGDPMLPQRIAAAL